MTFSAQWRTAAGVVAVTALLGAAGCGGGGNGGETSKQANQAPSGAKPGGDLTVLYAGDTDNVDPGITYYQYGMNIAYATQRPLYSYKPDDATKYVPDLAESDPQ